MHRRDLWAKYWHLLGIVFLPILYTSLKSDFSILVVAVWYMMWDNIGRIEENRSSMDIMPREWRSDEDAGSASSHEVQFDK